MVLLALALLEELASEEDETGVVPAGGDGACRLEVATSCELEGDCKNIIK
jgi:hypothetical protein